MAATKYSLGQSEGQSDIRNYYVFLDFIGIDVGVQEFVCKEICLIDGDHKYHKIIKSPYSFNHLTSQARESVLWDISRFSGIGWKCGEISFNDILHTLMKQLRNKTVILENEEKVVKLKEIILKNNNFEYISLQELGIDLDFKGPFDICSNHSDHNGYSQCYCALPITMQMKKFFDDNSDFFHILVNAMKAQKSCHLMKNKKNNFSENYCEQDYVFIDFVEFHIDGTLHVCKEFCLIDGDFITHNIIQSSDFENFCVNDQESILWEASNKNGLSYNSGDIDLEHVLQSTYKRINKRKVVVENRYKAEYIKVLFHPYCQFECIILEDLGFELDYDERPEICSHHVVHNAYSHCECASSMAKYLRNITKNNVYLMDTLVSIMRIKKQCFQHFK